MEAKKDGFWKKEYFCAKVMLTHSDATTFKSQISKFKKEQKN